MNGRISFNDRVKLSLDNCARRLENFRFNGDINAQNLYWSVRNLLEAIESLDNTEIKELEK